MTKWRVQVCSDRRLVPAARRQLCVLLCHCRPSDDPAATDPELQKRLAENRKIGKKRLDEVRCVIKAKVKVVILAVALLT